MILGLDFEEIRLLSEAAKRLPDLCPNLARAVRCCFHDLVLTEPVTAHFLLPDYCGTRKPAKAADKIAAQLTQDQDEDYGTITLSIQEARKLSETLLESKISRYTAR
jgi:hypothetical protein